MNEGEMTTNLDPEDIVDELLANSGFPSIDGDETVANLIARSGSVGWGVDTYGSLNAWFVATNKIDFHVDVHLDGDPDDGTSILGTSILAKVAGEAIKRDEHWEMSKYEVLEADFDPPTE